MSGLPVLLDVGGLDVLIVGGGAVAARKARAMLDAGARVRVVALAAGSELRALANHDALSVQHRAYAGGDIGDADVVIAATDDAEVNATVARDARALHRLVNVADDPSAGTFATMAVHRSEALVIGVSAGGVPAAAARIRDEIARRFDSRYGAALATLAAARRRLVERGDGERWRTRSAGTLDARFCERVEQGTIGGELDAWQ